VAEEDTESLFPGMRDVPASQALETLEALFKSAEHYVVYRIRRVPLDVSPTGGVTEVVSPSIREIMGVTDPEDLSTWFEAVHGDDLPRVMRAQMAAHERAAPFDEVMRIVRAGEVRWIHAVSHPVFDEDGEPTHHNGLIVDVTDRVRAEQEAEALRERLDATQRWQAVGTLGASVAHDFNNLLQGILTLSTIAQQVTGPKQTELLDDVVGLVARGATLTRDLLAYSRSEDEPTPEGEDVRPHVERVARVVDRLFVSLDVAVDTPDAPLFASVGGGELEQMLLNLAVNGAHATDERGHLTLRAYPTTSEEASALAGGPVSVPMVVVEVTDDGHGIEPDALERIFDSFYTTKESDRGTGLGLPTVHRLVSRRRGLVRVASTPGEGSTFRVMLPVARRAAAEETLPPPPPAALQPGDAILVVDVDAPLRRGLALHLERQGFAPRAAGSYVEALAIWERDAARIRAVITDTVMPGRGGLELARFVREQRADLPVLVISGHASEESLAELDGSPHTRFLRKPFVLSELDRALAELCAGG